MSDPASEVPLTASCAAVSWSFPVLAGISAYGPFVFFALMMVLQFVLVLKFLPETKGRSLEEIEKSWRSEHRS